MHVGEARSTSQGIYATPLWAAPFAEAGRSCIGVSVGRRRRGASVQLRAGRMADTRDLEG